MSTKILNVLLWLAQILAAVFFLFAAYAKLGQPIEESVKMMPWLAEQPGLAKMTGVFDLLGGLGLILPALLRIQPKLTTYAAIAGTLLVVAGMVFHLMRGETEVIGFNVFMIILLAFIAWGRTAKAPIAAKA